MPAPVIVENIQTPRTAPQQSRAKTILTWVAGFVVVVGGAVWGVPAYLHYLAHESTDNAFIEGTVVQVCPRATGQVLRVVVRDNQHVNEGALLAEIDPRDYQAALDQARAALAAAQARLKFADADQAMIRKTSAGAFSEQKAAVSTAEAVALSARARAVSVKMQFGEVQAHLEAAKATAEQTRAEVAALDAEDAQAAADLRRYENLFKSGGLSEVQLDHYRTAALAAQANAKAIKKRVNTNEAQILEAQAAAATAQEILKWVESQVQEADAKIEEARGRLAAADVVEEKALRAAADRVRAAAEVQQLTAALTQAELNLSYTKVIAPQTGTVTRKAVEAGNYVRTGQPLLGLVSDEKWVVANFKETQLARMRVGQAVRMHVDAYPGLVLEGKVDSLQLGTGARFSILPAENATGNYVKVVQRVPVKIVFSQEHEDPDRPLGVGMSVIPEVKIK